MQEYSYEFFRLMREFDDLFDIIATYKEIPRRYDSDIPFYPAEVHIMSHIAEGISTITELANHEQKTKSAMSQIVSRMAKKGLVEKCPSASSRREIFLRLTPKGEAAIESHKEMNRRLYKQLWDALNCPEDEKTRTISRFLSVLRVAYIQMIKTDRANLSHS